MSGVIDNVDEILILIYLTIKSKKNFNPTGD